MYKDGPFLTLEIPNEETGKPVKKFVSIPVLLERIWEEHKRGLLTEEYCKELLREIGFDQATILRMIKALQIEKAEYAKNDYMEVSYR